MRVCILLCLAAACGGSDTPQFASVHIISTGVTPAQVSIPVGGRVRFINDDTAQHQISSTDCSEIASPTLSQNQDYFASFAATKNCNYKDSLNPSSTGFQGVVTVTVGGSGGGGGGAGY